ncbi:hypothetical protein P4531_03345, partial [Geobacillus stearothermophilus]|uniref:hypothetical protein n=1 Tax=Geobacillus stearothermophilus TaxID=1422 RepID=UPI002E1F5E96|nr:hypothetical protein [Geobacillus stearothermophilus]
TKLKKDVRDFVEKYFLDTPEGPKSLDKSTFLEGGMAGERGKENFRGKAAPAHFAMVERKRSAAHGG